MDVPVRPRNSFVRSDQAVSLFELGVSGCLLSVFHTATELIQFVEELLATLQACGRHFLIEIQIADAEVSLGGITSERKRLAGQRQEAVAAQSPATYAKRRDGHMRRQHGFFCRLQMGPNGAE